MKKKQTQSKLLVLGTLPPGTTCKTPDALDWGMPGLAMRLVSVSEGSVRVQFLDRTRSVIIDGDVKASGIPTYSNIAFNTMVELYTPEPKGDPVEKTPKPARNSPRKRATARRRPNAVPRAGAGTRKRARGPA